VENRIDGTARERTRGHLIRAEYKRGKTPKEIAASVGVDVAIVNGFLGIAEPLSNGKFLLGSQEVTAEELQEKMAKIHAAENAGRELDRDSVLRNPPAGSSCTRLRWRFSLAVEISPRPMTSTRTLLPRFRHDQS
jgi:hypothetical protein